MLNLAAYYAAYGIRPAEIFQMSPGERAILWESLSRRREWEVKIVEALLSPYQKPDR